MHVQSLLRSHLEVPSLQWAWLEKGSPKKFKCYDHRSLKALVGCNAHGYSKIPKGLPSSPTEIRLYGNNIRTLTYTSSVNNKLPKALDLNSSNMMTIEPKVFDHFRSFEVLCLKNNRTSALHNQKFQTWPRSTFHIMRFDFCEWMHLRTSSYSDRNYLTMCF